MDFFRLYNLLPVIFSEGTNSFFFTDNAANSFFTSELSAPDLFLLRDLIRLSNLSSAVSFASPLQREEFFCTSGTAHVEDWDGAFVSTGEAEGDNEVVAVAFKDASDGAAGGIGRALITEGKENKHEISNI